MARKKDWSLIRDKEQVREITGRWSLNPIPRCGKCKGITHKAQIDLGARVARYTGNPRHKEIGRYCLKCDLFFPFKKKVVRVYDY